MFEHVLKSEVFKNEILAKYTTYGIGGRCRYFVFADYSEIGYIVNECIKNKLAYIVIGLGSNILVSDSGFDGVVIKIVNQDIEYLGDGLVKVFAGCTIFNLINFCRDNRLNGLEWAAGLPSTVGGAIFGNCGANGECFGDIVKTCTVLDNNCEKMYNKSECGFGYRKSIFDKNTIIISAILQLKVSLNFDCNRLFKDNLSSRIKKQPVGRTAGCVFKNTNGVIAGKIIDECGLKKQTVGGACVSEKHANFIVAKDNCKASDIYNLISYIKRVVFEKKGITLEEEIKYIGDFESI